MIAAIPGIVGTLSTAIVFLQGRLITTIQKLNTNFRIMIWGIVVIIIGFIGYLLYQLGLKIFFALSNYAESYITKSETETENS